MAQLAPYSPPGALPVSTDTTTPAHRRHDISEPRLGNHRTAPLRRAQQGGAPRRGQSPFQQRGVLDPPHWRPLARPAPGIRTLEHHRKPLRTLAEVSDDPDFERLMIDASHIKVRQHGTGAVGGNQSVGRPKGAEYQAAPGGGCPRDAGSDGGNGGAGGGLRPGGGVA